MYSEIGSLRSGRPKRDTQLKKERKERKKMYSAVTLIQLPNMSPQSWLRSSKINILMSFMNYTALGDNKKRLLVDFNGKPFLFNRFEEQ